MYKRKEKMNIDYFHVALVVARVVFLMLALGYSYVSLLHIIKNTIRECKGKSWSASIDEMSNTALFWSLFIGTFWI